MGLSGLEGGGLVGDWLDSDLLLTGLAYAGSVCVHVGSG